MDIIWLPRNVWTAIAEKKVSFFMVSDKLDFVFWPAHCSPQLIGEDRHLRSPSHAWPRGILLFAFMRLVQFSDFNPKQQASSACLNSEGSSLLLKHSIVICPVTCEQEIVIWGWFPFLWSFKRKNTEFSFIPFPFISFPQPTDTYIDNEVCRGTLTPTPSGDQPCVHTWSIEVLHCAAQTFCALIVIFCIDHAT